MPNPTLKRTAAPPLSSALGVGRTGCARLSIFPVPWLSQLGRNRQHRDQSTNEVVEDCVLEALGQNPVSNAVLILWSRVGVIAQRFNLGQDFGTKRLRKHWATVEVPKKRLTKLCLGLGQNLNREPSHQLAIRA